MREESRWGRQKSGWQGLVAAAAAGGALAAAAAAYAYWVEPFNIELERLDVHLSNAEGRLPARGLRILHLSDSHFRGRAAREHKKIEIVRRLVQGLEVDLLIHTGDFIHSDAGLPFARELLSVLPQPRLGAYAVFGNHDYTHYNMVEALPRMWQTFGDIEGERRAGAGAAERLARHITYGPRYVWYVRHTPLDGRRMGSVDTARLADLVRNYGYQILHNQVVHLNPDPSLDIYLAGVDDLVEGRPRLAHTLDGVPPTEPVILLSHNPDILVSPQMGRIDLMLSGHTHGGQMDIPLWGPAHTQVLYLPRRHVAGFFRRGRTQVYVSRGMGEGIPLRFNARPQIALITVYG